MPTSTPVVVLLGFAAWTLLILFGSVGIYRWSRILTGRATIAEWRADIPQGCDWYQRAIRAHMNCLENLPVYTALVVALMSTGLQGPWIDRLCVGMLVARVGQSIVHIVHSPTNTTVGLRFAFFLLQVVSMVSIGVTIAMHVI